jgi:hypothetical protein
MLGQVTRTGVALAALFALLGAGTVPPLSTIDPTAIAVDPQGDVFVADALGGRILKRSGATGKIAAIAGNNTSDLNGDGSSALKAGLGQRIEAMAADAAGNLYFLDVPPIPTESHAMTAFTAGAFSGCLPRCVRKIDARTGIISTVLTAKADLTSMSSTAMRAARAGSFDPHLIDAVLNSAVIIDGFTVDRGGGLYVANDVGHRILRITPAGTKKPVAGVLKPFAFGDPQVAATYSRAVTSDQGDGSVATTVALGGLSQIAVDSGGNVIFEEDGNDGTATVKALRRVDAKTGMISTIFGLGYPAVASKQPSPPLQADVCDAPPGAIAVDRNDFGTFAPDADGNVFLFSSNSPILQVDQKTGRTTIVSGKRAGDTAPCAPIVSARAAAVDDEGNIYVAEGGDNGGRVVRIAARTRDVTPIMGVPIDDIPSARNPVIAAPFVAPTPFNGANVTTVLSLHPATLDTIGGNLDGTIDLFETDKVATVRLHITTGFNASLTPQIYQALGGPGYARSVAIFRVATCEKVHEIEATDPSMESGLAFIASAKDNGQSTGAFHAFNCANGSSTPCSSPRLPDLMTGGYVVVLMSSVIQGGGFRPSACAEIPRSADPSR